MRSAPVLMCLAAESSNLKASICTRQRDIIYDVVCIKLLLERLESWNKLTIDHVKFNLLAFGSQNSQATFIAIAAIFTAIYRYGQAFIDFE